MILQFQITLYGDDERLRDVIDRNIYGTYKETDIDAATCDAMCDYTRRCEYALIQQDDSAVENGHIRFAKAPAGDNQALEDFA
jgi:hypothetical protein